MNTKRIAKWIIVLFLFATLPGMTAVLAEGQEPAGQLPVVTEAGESIAAIPWTNTETEANNSAATADDWCPTEPCGVQGGIILTGNDVDYWKVYVPRLYWEIEDDEYNPYGYYRHDHYPILVDIEAKSMNSPLDAIVCLYSDDGLELACSNDTDTDDPLLYYNLEVTNGRSPRNYYLKVSADHGAGAGARYQLLISFPYLLSAAAANLGTGNVDGIPFQAGDVLAYSRYRAEGANYRKWVMLIDLSDLGVKGNITNLAGGWRNSDFFLVGFTANVTLPGIGQPVTPWDVVVFNPTRVGPITEGTFQMWWDGSDLELTTAAEKVDAIDWPDWNGYTRLLVSTAGTAVVHDRAGATLKLPDEDIGLWAGGPANQGYPAWARALDTSGVLALATADVGAFSDIFYYEFDSDWETVGYQYLVTEGAARCGTIPVTKKDIVSIYWDFYVDGSGSEEPEWYCRVFWHGPDHGWNYNLDAIQVQQTVGGMQ